MRLFMALAVNKPVRDYLMKEVQMMRRQIKGRSWVPYQNYHITLHFLGETERIEELCYAMEESANGVDHLRLQINRIGRLMRPKSSTMVARISDACGELYELYDALKINLAKRNILVESRRFYPHITLARSLETNDVAQFVRPLEDGPIWTAQSFTLYNSTFVDSHMLYTPIHTQLLYPTYNDRRKMASGKA